MRGGDAVMACGELGTSTQLGDTQTVAARQGRRLGGRGRQLHKQELGGGQRGRRRNGQGIPHM